VTANPAASAVVFAYHNVGVRCLAVLLQAGVRVPLVLSHEDDARETIWFDSVARLAAGHGIPVITPDDPNTPEIIGRLRQLAPDFLFSFYYRRMLSPALLSVPRRGAFNMHGSLLPQFRGRVPVNWAVIKGATRTGATLHEMVEKPDAGRIVDQEAVPIGPDDRAIDVFAKVTDASETVLRRALPGLIDGTAVLRAQDLKAGSYFGGRKPEDGRIDWSRPAAEVHNLVRGVAPPYPGAFTDIGDRRVRILRTRVEAGRRAKPGGPGLYGEAEGVYADCGDGGVLRVVEAEGLPELGAEKIIFGQRSS